MVVTRRVGETLVIGGNVQVTILAANPDKYVVKLGVTAPKDIAVWRQELHDVIAEQQRLESEDRQGD